VADQEKNLRGAAPTPSRTRIYERAFHWALHRRSVHFGPMAIG